MKAIRTEWLRLLIGAASAGLLLLLFMLPTPAAALEAAIATPKATYKLGEVVQLEGDVKFAENETADITDVSVVITGPQPATISELPIGEVTNKNLTSLLPKATATDSHFTINDPLGKLIGTVVATQIQALGYGYGYGYGYKGLSVLSKFRYLLKYTPPIFKFPQPSPLKAPFNNPDPPIFPVPGATAGGVGSVTASLFAEMPPAPGAPPGSEPQGMTSVFGTSLATLVKGDDNLGVILIQSSFDGFLFDFRATEKTNTHALASDSSGDYWVSYTDGTDQKIIKVKGCGFGSSLTFCAGSAKTITVSDVAGPLKGLVFFGGSLYASEFESDVSKPIKIHKINPSNSTHGTNDSGNDFTLPGGPTGGGLNTLDWDQNQNTPNLFGANGNKVVKFAPSGNIIDTKTIDKGNGGGTLDIQGMAFLSGFGGNDKFFFADKTTKALWKVEVEAAGAIQFNLPRGMADDGTNFWFVIDGEGGNDKLQKANKTTGAAIGGAVSLPSNFIEALAFLGNKLYVVDNNESPAVKLYRFSTAGTNETASGITCDSSFGSIGGMASDGTDLWMAELYSNIIHKVKASDCSKLATIFPFAAGGGVGGVFPPSGLNGLVFVPASQSPTGSNLLIGVNGNTFWRIKPADGSVLAVDFTAGKPPFDMTAAVFSGNVFVGDSGTQAIYEFSIPGQPAPELTTIGNYSALFKATTNPTTVTSPTAASYALAKVATVTVAITSPADNSGVTASPITITGTINDPTVTQVGISTELPETVLFGNVAKTDVNSMDTTGEQNLFTKNGLWHFTTQARAKGPGIFSGVPFQNVSTVAYYGQGEPDNPNYNTFTANFGDLDTAAFTVGDPSKVVFDTWYETEPGFFFDQKRVEFCETGGSCTLVALLSPDPPIVIVGGFPQPNFLAPQGTVWTFPQGFPTPPEITQGTKMVYITNALFDGAVPKMTTVSLDITSFKNKQGKVRFRLDTKDPIANDFTGWVINNVIVQGKGSLLLAPGTVDPDNLTWSIPSVKVTEGKNKIDVTASRTAYDAQSASATVNVFLDTVAPVVALDAITSPTNLGSIKVTGSFVDDTPDTLEVFVGDKLVLSSKSFTGLTFEVFVNLSEGSNVIKAKLKDKGGLCNTATPANCATAIAAAATKTVVLDTTSPGLTSSKLTTAYPVGFVSGRPGDLVVFQMKAADNTGGSGIASVKAKTPNSSTFDASFRTDIPEAVKAQWGISSQATHLLPFLIGLAVPPGKFTMQVEVKDAAGNADTGIAVEAQVVAALEGFTVNLMPGDNLISLPLIPTGVTGFDEGGLDAPIDNLVASVVPGVQGKAVFDTIVYFDAAKHSDASTHTSFTTETSVQQALHWHTWVPDTQAPRTLTKATTGRGYWVKTKGDAFVLADPIAAGFSNTAKPIKLSYLGTFLLSGKAVPPTYTVKGPSWNLMGFHSEKTLKVSDYFAALFFPSRNYVSSLEFQNFIDFPITPGEPPSVVLGAFKRLLDTDSLTPGRGVWVFSNADGLVVP